MPLLLLAAADGGARISGVGAAPPEEEEEELELELEENMANGSSSSAVVLELAAARVGCKSPMPLDMVGGTGWADLGLLMAATPAALGRRIPKL